jgi:hypothetical protein
MSDDPRLDPRYDARLSELISDTADSVEPGEGLTAIRSRTRPDHDQETTMSSSRNWLYAVGGAVAGTAAVIIAIAVVSQLNDDDPTQAASSSPSASESAGQPSESTAPTGTATDTPSSSAPTGTPVEGAVPVYYAGDSGRGTVLFREFQPGIGGDPVAQAAYATVAGPSLDPDYRTLWPAGSEATASYDGDVITVDLTGGALHDKPKGMSKRDAELAIQQVVYSVQGAAEERAGVQLLLDGQRTDQVLGQPASEPLTNADPATTLTMMNVTLPEDGMVVSGDTLGAEGVASAFEATFQWEIRLGDQVVAKDFAMTQECCKLSPWEVGVDLSDLAPGTYTFVATNDDPSGGEGFAPDSDSKTFVIE